MSSTAPPRFAARVLFVVGLCANVLTAHPAAAQEAPENDDFASAIQIGGIPFEYESSLAGATTETGEPNCNDLPRTVWFTFTATSEQDLVASTDAESLAVYQGGSLTDMKEVGCEAGYATGSVAFRTVEGAAYKVQVSGDERADYTFLLRSDDRGKIAGIITDGSGAPVTDGCAYAWLADFDEDSEGPVQFGPGKTDAQGRYQIGNLSSGEYRVHLTQCPWPRRQTLANEWYDDKPDRESSDVVHVEENATTSGINGALALGGTISGAVTDESGVPLEGICVLGWAPHIRTEDVTDASGRYTLTGFATGTAHVAFAHDGECGRSSPYLLEWYDDQPDMESADPVPVTEGQNTQGIDAQLRLGGSISGVVTGPDGVPLKDICVSLETRGGTLADGRTDETGSYRVEGVAGGEYSVRFMDCSGEDLYLTEWHEDRSSREEADLVSVGVGEETTGIDAELSRGGSISGTVRGPDGDPLGGICVSASRTRFGSDQYGLTDDEGRYRIGSLSPGQYRIEFTCGWGEHAPEWYDDQPDYDSADPVTVDLGEDLVGIDADLSRAGSISGRVTASDGSPLEGVAVFPHDENGVQTGFAWTDEDGRYRVDRLREGPHRLHFVDLSGRGFESEWFDDRASFDQADPVPVIGGEEAVGIDAELANLEETSITYTGPTKGVRGGTAQLTARLADSDGTGVSGKPVLFRLKTGSTVRQSISGSTGPDGVVRSALALDVDAGTYSIEVVFEGDATHAASSAIRPFIVEKRPTTLSLLGASSVAAGSIPVEARLVDATSGSGIAGQRVSFQLMRGAVLIRQESATTTGDGRALATFQNVPAGSYEIVADFAGDGTYLSSRARRSLEVTRRASRLAFVGSQDKPYTTRSVYTFEARLTDDEGSGVAGRVVRFWATDGDIFLGESVGHSDESGRAVAHIMMEAGPGQYTIQARFDGDGAYEPSTETESFWVVKGSASVSSYDGAAQGTAGDTVPMRARVVDWFTDEPLLGVPVEFRLGATKRVGASGADGWATVQMPLEQTPAKHTLVIEAMETELYRPAGPLSVPFEVRWQHEFESDLSNGTVQLNPFSKQFRLRLGSESASSVKHDPTMQDHILPNGERVVTVSFSDEEMEMVGKFNLSTGKFVAATTYADTPRVLTNLGEGTLDMDELRQDGGRVPLHPSS